MQNTNQYPIQFDVGDWSDDGHGLSDSYVTFSNVPVEYLVKFHDMAEKTIGVKIGEICSDWEQNTLFPLTRDALIKNHVILEDEFAGELDADHIFSLWKRCIIHSARVHDGTFVEFNDLKAQRLAGKVDTPGYGVYFD